MGDERYWEIDFEETFFKFSEKKIQNVLGYW